MGKHHDTTARTSGVEAFDAKDVSRIVRALMYAGEQDLANRFDGTIGVGAGMTVVENVGTDEFGWDGTSYAAFGITELISTVTAPWGPINPPSAR